MPAECHGHIDAQTALRPQPRTLYSFVGRFEVRQNAAASVEIFSAVCSERDAPGGAMKEPHTEMAFELCHLGAHRCARQLEGIRRTRERVEIGHARKRAHACQLVHPRSLNPLIVSANRTMNSRLAGFYGTATSLTSVGSRCHGWHSAVAKGPRVTARCSSSTDLSGQWAPASQRPC